MDKLKNAYHFAKKDKKGITLFTTLVNIKCLTYYLFSLFFFVPNTQGNITFSYVHFIAIIIPAIFDLLLCWGFVHSCVRANINDSCKSSDEAKSASEKAKELLYLKRGDITTSGIYSFNHVAQIERDSIEGDEIWCISGDIEEDSKNDELGNIISDNLKKGVVYKYFVTRVDSEISPKANLGEQTLREANLKYKNRLFFIKTQEEFIAPDIDIIIYKANQLEKRIGFVCVEIGEDRNTYVYQKIDPITLQGICDKLISYSTSRKKANVFKTVYNGLCLILRSFIKYLSVPYAILSAGVLTLLSFSKIVSWESAVLFLIPAAIEFLITIAFTTGLNDIVSDYKDIIAEESEVENTLADIINSPEVSPLISIMKKTALEKLMNQKDMGIASKILKVDSNCSTIWLLSNLSYDIANQDFYDWLQNELKAHPNTNCHILYIQNTAAEGRRRKLDQLVREHPQQIKVHGMQNISAHLIWSQTHGIILIENNNGQHGVYISLGSNNEAFFKKVITTESESATLLGLLSRIADIEIGAIR